MTAPIAAQGAFGRGRHVLLANPSAGDMIAINNAGPSTISITASGVAVTEVPAGAFAMLTAPSGDAVAVTVDGPLARLSCEWLRPHASAATKEKAKKGS